MISEAADEFVTFHCDSDDFALAGLDLLDIGERLLVANDAGG
jgi:hypothetical protein